MVCGKEAGEIIATSANQIGPLKFLTRYSHQIPLSSWRESGFETIVLQATDCSEAWGCD